MKRAGPDKQTRPPSVDPHISAVRNEIYRSQLLRSDQAIGSLYLKILLQT